MTRPVRRSELVDVQSYERVRPKFREEVLLAKNRRRVHVGEYFTFLFENTVTIRYQIQEMLRAEHITEEAGVLHEVETYNSLLGGANELGCTLLIEIDDADQRAVRLREWFALPEHIYVRLPDGTQVRAAFDESQRGAGRLSSVQYLKFRVGRTAPTAVGIDLPGAAAETTLTPEQRTALAEDLE
jgi:hypothetical protein